MLAGGKDRTFEILDRVTRRLQCCLLLGLLQLPPDRFLSFCSWPSTISFTYQPERFFKIWESPTWCRCYLYYLSSVQSLSHVWLFVTPCTAAQQAPVSSTISQSLLKLMSIESVMPSNHLILCCPLLLSPSIFPSIRVFSSELVHLHHMAKVLECQLQHLLGCLYNWGKARCKYHKYWEKCPAVKVLLWSLSWVCFSGGDRREEGFSSVQFSRSVVSDSLQPHRLQHARPPCPSPSPGVYPKSCPLNRWCHPTISSSVVPFSSCLQSFPASGPFQMSQLFASGGKSFGVSASTSVLPMNIQDWFPLGWTGWISLLSKGLSRVCGIWQLLKMYHLLWFLFSL